MKCFFQKEGLFAGVKETPKENIASDYPGLIAVRFSAVSQVNGSVPLSSSLLLGVQLWSSTF